MTSQSDGTLYGKGLPLEFDRNLGWKRPTPKQSNVDTPKDFCSLEKVNASRYLPSFLIRPSMEDLANEVRRIIRNLNLGNKIDLLLDKATGVHHTNIRYDLYTVTASKRRLKFQRLYSVTIKNPSNEHLHKRQNPTQTANQDFFFAPFNTGFFGVELLITSSKL